MTVAPEQWKTARMYRERAVVGSWDMGQKPSEGTEPENHPVAAKREARPSIPRHNPATEQMLVVGKRREEAEAKLQQRLLNLTRGPETPAD